MSSRAASLGRASFGFGLSVVAALSVVAQREISGVGRVEFLAAPAPFTYRFLLWGPALTVVALLGFGLGLLPLAFMRGSIRYPLLAGAGVGLFWLCLAIAGLPYSLGLTAPAGAGLVSVFLGVLVSGAAIGRSVLSGESEDAA